jgi:hypothetical protein
MEELMQQLIEVPWRELVTGNEYMTLNVLNSTRIIEISQVELLEQPSMFGSGPVGDGSGAEQVKVLNPGDVIELDVAGIGKLSNKVVRNKPLDLDISKHGGAK